MLYISKTNKKVLKFHLWKLLNKSIKYFEILMQTKKHDALFSNFAGPFHILDTMGGSAEPPEPPLNTGLI